MLDFFFFCYFYFFLERGAAAEFTQQDIKDGSEIMQLSPSYVLILLSLLLGASPLITGVHCLSLRQSGTVSLLCEDNCEVNHIPFLLSVLPYSLTTECSNNKITVEGPRKIIQLSRLIVIIFNTSKYA